MARCLASAISGGRIIEFRVEYKGDDIDDAVRDQWRARSTKKKVPYRKEVTEIRGFVFPWEGEWIGRYWDASGNYQRREFASREAAEMWILHRG